MKHFSRVQVHKSMLICLYSYTKTNEGTCVYMCDRVIVQTLISFPLITWKRNSFNKDFLPFPSNSST